MDFLKIWPTHSSEPNRKEGLFKQEVGILLQIYTLGVAMNGGQ